MYRIASAAVAAFMALIYVTTASAQSPAKKKDSPPRLVPVAETKLLMEGLAQPNFQGIERILKNDQADAESWTFARGQAILIAETANLLMLRPPRNTGQDAWMQHAAKLRDAATDLARTVAAKDRNSARDALSSLANQCNRCHQTFRVATKISAFAPAEENPAPRKP